MQKKIYATKYSAKCTLVYNRIFKTEGRASLCLTSAENMLISWLKFFIILHVPAHSLKALQLLISGLQINFTK